MIKLEQMRCVGTGRRGGGGWRRLEDPDSVPLLCGLELLPLLGRGVRKWIFGLGQNKGDALFSRSPTLLGTMGQGASWHTATEEVWVALLL